MKYLLRAGGIVLFSLLASCGQTAPKISPPYSKTLAKPAKAIPVTRAEAVTVSATLTWDANLPSELIAFYNVYEVLPRTLTLPMRWGLIGTTTATQFTISGLTPGSYHIYSVTAVNSVRESSKAFCPPYRAQ